jgi:hypothetical protein
MSTLAATGSWEENELGHVGSGASSKTLCVWRLFFIL